MSAPRGRIAHIMPFPEIGGTELQTLQIVKAARGLGFDNRIYCLAGATAVVDLFKSEGFETEIYPPILPSYRRPGAFLRASMALAKSFRTHGVVIVHCADILAGAASGLAGRLARARVISHVRNPYPGIPRRERSFLLPVERFVFISKEVQRELGVAESRKRGPIIYGVPGAVLASPRDPLEARKRFGLTSDGPVVGTGARMAPQKDYATLIRAARVVKRAIPNVQFLVAADIDGSSSNREYFRDLQPLLDETGTRDVFKFAGFQPEMSWFYGAIDAFVLSSHFEGLGSVLLEAIQQRKPIVATSIGGIPEVILDGKTGLLSPLQSPEIMGEQLIRILTDPSLSQRLTAGASTHLENTFGVDRFSRQLDQLYSDLLM